MGKHGKYGIYMGNILEIMMFHRDDNGICMGFIREIEGLPNAFPV